MLWMKKKGSGDAANVAITPSPLRVTLDPVLANQKLNTFLDFAESRGGVDEFVAALQNKQKLFEKALSREYLEDHDVFTLLETVFTSRRKLNANHVTQLMLGLTDLIADTKPVQQRMVEFVGRLQTDDKKLQRAAWDFAAEVLHFYRPEAYPLMCRWVWDAHNQSGATREFIRGNDAMRHIDITDSPEDFEAVRVWLSEQLREQGFYRDITFMVDLVLAQAYAEYVLAMSSGMGMMGSEFGGRMEPVEFVVKMLGIDPHRRNGKSRVKHKHKVIH